MSTRNTLLSLFGALSLSSPGVALSQQVPSSGTAVLQAMFDAYAGKWYRTLSFAQKTTLYGRDGIKRIQAWRESLRYTEAGTQLRIDFGDPAQGNSVLYTADSSWRFSGGKLAAHDANGNFFLPLIEGVYMQPVARTAAELASTHVDLNKITSGTWAGKPVWIVGASSAADSTSSQFWVDPSTKVVVRAILKLGPGNPLDIHLDDYVAVGGGMLATKVSIFSNGAPQQIEDYADWRVDIRMDDALFNVASWISANRM